MDAPFTVASPDGANAVCGNDASCESRESWSEQGNAVNYRGRLLKPQLIIGDDSGDLSYAFVGRATAAVIGLHRLC